MAQQTRRKSGRSSNGRGSSQSRPRSAASSRRSTSRSTASKGAISTAKDATVTGAKSTGNAVASAAKQLKTPAIAAGVGLAGLAGGIAIGRTKNTKGFDIPLLGGGSAHGTSRKLSSAAKNVGALAEQTGQVAERVRLVSEAMSGKDTGPTRRSPIEVVLEGLTRRSIRSPRA